jgi:ribosomal protein L16 Arg81 hydroxylase
LSRLRVLVTRKFQGDNRATQALLLAEQHPQDDQAVRLLRQTLEDHAARDAQFATELQRLIDEARRRPEYQSGSKLFDNYGWVGKITVFNAPIRLDQGDFNIN